MDNRIKFAMKALKCGNFRELCREYGISAKTGYIWSNRFLEGGLAGMEEKSRRPHSHSEELPEAVVCEIIRLKQAHLHWGARKIRNLYERKHPGEPPSESSFKRILEAGLNATPQITLGQGPFVLRGGDASASTFSARQGIFVAHHHEAETK